MQIFVLFWQYVRFCGKLVKLAHTHGVFAIIGLGQFLHFIQNFSPKPAL